MKKILCVFLVLVMLVALASCGTKIPNTDVPMEAVTPKTPDESPVIVLEMTYIWDQVKNIWNIYRTTATGELIPGVTFTQLNDNPNTPYQRITYAPVTMDMPIFTTEVNPKGEQTNLIWDIRTGNDVFTSGAVGTPECTGEVTIRGRGNTNLHMTWKLKDGVLIVQGDDVTNGFLSYGRSPWCDNPYIRTVIWDVDASSFSDRDLFNNCPNLETFIVTHGTYWECCDYGKIIKAIVDTDGKYPITIPKPWGANVDLPKIIEMHTSLDYELEGAVFDYTKDGQETNVHRTMKNRNVTWDISDTSPWPGNIPAELTKAYLTQEAADIINTRSVQYGYGFTVTANASGDNTVATTPTPAPEPTPTPAPTPEPTPVQPTTPVTTGYDPSATDGGSAANPICSAWARDDVIAAWNLFANRIPYNSTTTPRTNIIEKDLTQPISRAEFATLAAAAYDYILGDTAENIGFDWMLEMDYNARNAAHALLAPAQSGVTQQMTDLFNMPDITRPDKSTPHYYIDGILAAANMGLMNGYSDTAFGVDDHLTREQAATVLGRIADRYSAFPYRANPSESAAFPASTGNPYTDTISDWARDGVLRARAAGIMIGTSDTEFSAKSDFTREQALVTLYRMVTWCKPWYRELTESELGNTAVHAAANPIRYS